MLLVPREITSTPSIEMYGGGGIMNKNVLQSFCVVHYIVPADVPGDAIYYPVCWYIVTNMSLYRTFHTITLYFMLPHRTRWCYIAPLMLLHHTLCCYIILGDALLCCSCYYNIPYAAMLYTVMLCCEQYAATSYLPCHYIVLYAAIS